MICYGYSFELHRQIDAIQMGTHNICFYKAARQKDIGCNLKTMELLDCALKGVCVLIGSNTVFNYVIREANTTSKKIRFSILITTHTPISAQTSNFLIHRLQHLSCYLFFF